MDEFSNKRISIFLLYLVSGFFLISSNVLGACGDFGSVPVGAQSFCQSLGPSSGYTDCTDYGEKFHFYAEGDLVKYECYDKCGPKWWAGCDCEGLTSLPGGQCSECTSHSDTFQDCVTVCGSDCDSECVQAVDCSPASGDTEASPHLAGCEYLNGQFCTNNEGKQGTCSSGVCLVSDLQSSEIRIWEGNSTFISHSIMDWTPVTNCSIDNDLYTCNYYIGNFSDPSFCQYEGDYYFQWRFKGKNYEGTQEVWYYTDNSSEMQTIEINPPPDFISGIFMYNISYDADPNDCECKFGAESYNVGGEVSATTCCGDDPNEFKNYRNVSDTMENEFVTNSSDKACCDSKTDCVYNNACYAAGWVHGDVDGDGVIGEEGISQDKDVCLIDSSGFSKWFDCFDNDQCGGDSTKSICDKTSHDCIEVNCNNGKDDDNDGKTDVDDEDCKLHTSYTGEIGFCPASMIKDGNEPCFISKDEGCVLDGEIVNDMLCRNGSWYSRQSMGFASLYPNRKDNFILKCDSLINYSQNDDLFNALNYNIYPVYSPDEIISQCVQSICYLASADEMTFLFNINPDRTDCLGPASPSYIFSNVGINEGFTANSNSRDSFENYALDEGGYLFYNNYTKQLVYSNTTDLSLSVAYSHDSDILKPLYASLSQLSEIQAGDHSEVLKNSSVIRSLIYYEVGDVSILGKNAQNATSSASDYGILYTASVLYDGIPEKLELFLADRFENACGTGMESVSCGYHKDNNIFYSSLLTDGKINGEFWHDYTSMLFSNIR